MNNNVKDIYLLFLKYNIRESSGLDRSLKVRNLHSNIAIICGIYSVWDKLLIKGV